MTALSKTLGREYYTWLCPEITFSQDPRHRHLYTDLEPIPRGGDWIIIVSKSADAAGQAAQAEPSANVSSEQPFIKPSRENSRFGGNVPLLLTTFKTN
jgi:hypothetical protein